MNKLFILFVFSSCFIIVKGRAQGCVAIRSTGGIGATVEQSQDTSSGWLFNSNNRYFKSFRHFSGTKENKDRQTQHTEVINHSYTMDLSLTRIISPRWSAMIDVPIESYSRSSLYEHDRVNRYTTHSFGVGDIRFAVYGWIADPVRKPRGNVQVGLGVKLPTGNYNYQDYFHISDTSTRLGAVDQSIQLGDGGTGLTLELNGYYSISKLVTLYGNFYYLANPREQNGVSNTRGGTPTSDQIKNGSAIMSVPDQYMARAGVNLNFGHLMISAGARHECLPVHDLIGGSGGWRRPGYIFSAEPGVTYSLKKIALYAYVPVAIVRARTQSVPDKITTAMKGVKTVGDAAFANYVVNIGCTVSL